MMGAWRAKLRVVVHDCNDQTSLAYAGATQRGMPVYVNKHYAAASLKILTGVITPHQLAGFGGGRKSVVPGICGLETLQIHHSFPIRPATPMLGIIKDNTFHEEAVAGARLTGVDFIVNVVKNYRGQVVEAVAGDLEAAHTAGVAICEKSWVRKFRKAYDVVFVSPGRYPKDIDLHQAQKGLVVAEQVTRPGGTIVVVAECRNGVGKFGKVLREADSVDAVIRDFYAQGFTPDHNSKAYMFARCCKDHRVFVVSSGVSPKELSDMFMTGFTSLSEAATAALASYHRPSVLCIPYAGECIPVVESAATAAHRYQEATAGKDIY
jgi:nickel-dependent lactate racemase